MVANAPGQGGAFGNDSPAKGPVAGTTEPFGKPIRRKKGLDTGKLTDLDKRSIPKKYRNWIT
jgi:hypothetical protein